MTYKNHKQNIITQRVPYLTIIVYFIIKRLKMLLRVTIMVELIAVFTSLDTHFKQQ